MDNSEYENKTIDFYKTSCVKKFQSFFITLLSIFTSYSPAFCLNLDTITPEQMCDGNKSCIESEYKAKEKLLRIKIIDAAWDNEVQLIMNDFGYNAALLAIRDLKMKHTFTKPANQ